jgi:hypothetical protein
LYIFLGNDTESWVLRNNGNIYFNNQVKLMTNKEIEEGDIIVKIKKKIINFCFSKQNL